MSKEQLTRANAQRKFYEYIIEEHDKHLSKAMLNVKVAQLELDNVRLKRQQAPSDLAKALQRIQFIELSMKKSTINPKVKKILVLREKLAQLEAEE